MFDFEQLEVYKKAKSYNKSTHNFIKQVKLDNNDKNQLKRASFSIMLNIAEGSGRFTKKDKRNFYIISRGSCYECVSIFDYLHEVEIINSKTYKAYYLVLEQISKMLHGLIKKLE